MYNKVKREQLENRVGSASQFRAPNRPNSLADHRPFMFEQLLQRYELYSCWKQKRAAGMETIQSRWGLSALEQTRRKRSERRDVGLCLRPSIKAGMRFGSGGEAEGGDVCWGMQEEIQLGYTRIECIFNHRCLISWCDCQLLKEGLPSPSLSLSCPCSSDDRQHNTRQLRQDLIWRQERTFYSGRK